MHLGLTISDDDDDDDGNDEDDAAAVSLMVMELIGLSVGTGDQTTDGAVIYWYLDHQLSIAMQR